MVLRVALLGCGPLGRSYATLLAATGATVLVAFDGDRDLSTEFAIQAGARVAPTRDDAVSAVGVDAIVVCVDGNERLQAIDSAAIARRHVFDAMPLHSGAVKALDGVQAGGAMVGVDLRLRHDARIREVADAVQRGEIGEVRSCSIVVSDDAMSIDESLAHDLDLARFLTGSEIVGVAGASGQGTTMLLLTHLSGAVTSIEQSDDAVAGTEVRVELAGTAGIVSSRPMPLAGAGVRTADGDHRRRRASDSTEPCLRAQWVSFANSVHDGEPTGAVDDAHAALLATRAALTALAERRTITIADIAEIAELD